MTPYLRNFDLSGTTAVVTGASRGIGAEIAVGLMEAGANVTTLQRSAPGEDLLAVAARERRRLEHVEADFASEESIAAAISGAIRIAPIGILVNNAGTQIRHDSVDFPLTDFDKIMDINTRAVFQLCAGFARAMIDRRSGKIVNLSSLLAFQGGLRVPAYAASKGAVDQLTKAFANEWAPFGVNVNAVAPGYVATDMNANLLADENRSAQISARIPAGRWGKPSDIVGAVVFLCSGAADYIHGVTLPVDGGWLGR
jgi:2-deoxy-D-gluconate 3-dehydrogenase